MTIQKITLLCLACTLYVGAGKVYAQKEANTWYFGVGNALKFDADSTRLSKVGVMNTMCNVIFAKGFTTPASMSNPTGRLLFYSDGLSVWNSRDELVTNGTELLGGVSVVVVPFPQQPNKFLIFTLGFGQTITSLKLHEKPKRVPFSQQRLDSFQRGLLRHSNLDEIQLRYSILDMSQNNGKGAILEKNILLKQGLLPDFTVANHQNGQDFWLIARAHRTEEFATYLISEKGIAEKPILQKIGNIFELVYSYTEGAPSFTFKATMQGNKIAIASHNNGKQTSSIQVFDFDNKNGKLVNAKIIDKGDSRNGMNSSGIEFSPDGKKLYSAQITNYENNTLKYAWEIAEYDLSKLHLAPTISNIPILAQELKEGTFPNYLSVCNLQLAPDMCIYFSSSIYNFPNNTGSFIGCIEKPNEGIKGGINKTKYFDKDGLGAYNFPKCTHLLEIINQKSIELGKPFTRPILFETNQAILKPEHEKELQDILAYLLQNPKTTIEISGHTDNEGEETKNKTLSEARAQSLANFLVTKGVAKERIKAIGYGSAKPIAENTTPAGKAKNRRIEFLIK